MDFAVDSDTRTMGKRESITAVSTIESWAPERMSDGEKCNQWTIYLVYYCPGTGISGILCSSVH